MDSHLYPNEFHNIPWAYRVMHFELQYLSVNHMVSFSSHLLPLLLPLFLFSLPPWILLLWAWYLPLLHHCHCRLMLVVMSLPYINYTTFLPNINRIMSLPLFGAKATGNPNDTNRSVLFFFSSGVPLGSSMIANISLFSKSWSVTHMSKKLRCELCVWTYRSISNSSSASFPFHHATGLSFSFAFTQ